MAIDLTPEQRETGSANYVRATEGLTRRGFMKSMAVAGLAAVPVSAAVYFGYESLHGRPVKAALIGAGDEGGVLVGEHNPEYLEFVAVCDIRPSNMKRIFEGEPAGLRKGFNRIYGNNAEKSIKKYGVEGDKVKNVRAGDYLTMLKENPEIEAVVIATPLCWHAKMAIDVMNAGKARGRPIHVLSEKLMGWNVMQCKKMVQTAEETGSILAVGHQRHYSLLYAHAVDILKNGILGDIKYIQRSVASQQLLAVQAVRQAKGANGPRGGAAVFQGRLVQPGPPRGLRQAERQDRRLSLRQRGAADPLALLQLDGRRPHGGAGQPPARRVQHLPRPRPSAGRQRHRRQILLRPTAGLRRNQRIRIPDQLE